MLLQGIINLDIMGNLFLLVSNYENRYCRIPPAVRNSDKSASAAYIKLEHNLNLYRCIRISNDCHGCYVTFGTVIIIPDEITIIIAFDFEKSSTSVDLSTALRRKIYGFQVVWPSGAYARTSSKTLIVKGDMDIAQLLN